MSDGQLSIVLNCEGFSEKAIHGALTTLSLVRVPGRYHARIRCAFTGRFRRARRSRKVVLTVPYVRQEGWCRPDVAAQIGIAAEMKQDDRHREGRDWTPVSSSKLEAEPPPESPPGGDTICRGQRSLHMTDKRKTEIRRRRVRQTCRESRQLIRDTQRVIDQPRQLIEETRRLIKDGAR